MLCVCLWCSVTRTHCVNWWRINFNHKLHNLWNTEHFLLIYCLEVFGFCGFKFIIISMFGNKLISWHILTAKMKKTRHTNDVNHQAKRKKKRKKNTNIQQQKKEWMNERKAKESKLKFVVTACDKKSALLMYPYNIHLQRMCSIPFSFFFAFSISFPLFFLLLLFIRLYKPLKRLMRRIRDENQPSFK